MNNAWLLTSFFRPLLLTVCALAVLLGVWWILQGTGAVTTGFKAHHMTWAWRGMGLVAGGLLMAFLSRRN
ncbi:MAG TPA: hypothetical protein VII56_16415 [Rhizomicrobium sp.]